MSGRHPLVGHFAARFSAKEARPSLASADWRLAEWLSTNEIKSFSDRSLHADRKVQALVSAVACDARIFSSDEARRTESIHFRSAPAWKCLPLPLRTTTRRFFSTPSASSAASRPSIMAPL